VMVISCFGLRGDALSKRRQYRGLPDVGLRAQLDAKIRAMIEIADREIEEARVNFRWGGEQLASVKRAAILGVPYQTYIKQGVFRQAVADIRDAASVADMGGDEPRA
jgi:hypothetical protein